MLQNRYMVSNETLSLTQAALDLAEESGERGQIAWARFVHGFGLLWHGDLQGAETQISDALAVAERTGDLVHQARCTTYLAIIYRLRGHVAETQRYALAALDASETVQMTEYVATAAANLGWVAWREADEPTAYSQLEQAVVLWQQLPDGHPSASVRWTAYFPLLAMALSEGRLKDAISHARILLKPECQRLPDVLAGPLTAADAAWRSHEEGAVQHHLVEAIQQAHFFGYL